jgi:hypothetical protein
VLKSVTKNFCFIFLTIICSYNNIFAQKQCDTCIDDCKSCKEYKQRGYMLLITSYSYPFMIFFSNDSAFCGSYDFRQIEKIKGQFIRSTFDSLRIKMLSNSESIEIKQKFYNQGQLNVNNLVINMVAVEIRYVLIPETRDPDSEISFDYNGEPFSVKYEDRWNLIIQGVKILNG